MTTTSTYIRRRGLFSKIKFQNYIFSSKYRHLKSNQESFYIKNFVPSNTYCIENDILKYKNTKNYSIEKLNQE